MSTQRFTVLYEAVIPAGSTCKSPSVVPVNPQGLSVPCSDANSVDIQINSDVPGPYCLTFIVTCTGCASCGQIEVTRCFCLNGEDCENCSNCEDHICVTRCPGQLCDNDTCVDCDDEHPCPQNQICSQGTCRCPADKPIRRADGKCVECLDGEDLGPCRICVNGVISSTICPNGVCNPENGNCQECYNNEQCLLPNQCCNAVGTCDCCPGYILDPITNECVEAPPCTNAQSCIDRFGPCSYCTEDGCQPKVCPNGGICDPTTGECVPPCGNCPEGSGCINGMCIPCSQLSCGGTGLLCEFAVGCECNGTACEYINCNPDTVDLVWERTPSTQGDIITPGQPSLSGTTSIVPLSMVYAQSPNGAGYYNHRFDLGITNGTTGNFTLYNTPTQTIALGSGTSVSFDLTSTGPNLVGFLVRFVETGTGRTATWGIFRTPTAHLDQQNVWYYEFQSTGTPPTTSGGTQGSVQLCATNSNFIPTGVTNVVTTGTISVTLIPTGTNCMFASISGCGTWNGDIILSCGGTTITIPADELTIDPANCCDPLDPNCDGFGTGDPCQSLTIQPITLVALPTFGEAPSGDGEFLIIADWTTAGLSFIDLFYLDPADGCWSTANNPASSSNDIQIVTGAGQSPLGPSVSNLSVLATLGDGGCVRLGYTCELKLPGCKKLQGEVCLTECQAFSVNIISLGGNSYTVVPSLNDEVITYQWSVFGGGTITNATGQTITLNPAGGTTTLRVDARYGSPVVKCTAFDVLVLNTTVPGCRNPLACNYNAGANVDDGTCVLISNPSYDCVLGGFIPGLTSGLPETMPIITYQIEGTAILSNDPINAGTYTVDVYFDGVQKCSKTLVVPQCYRCVAENCVAAPVGGNTGQFTANDCNGGCSCLIDIQAPFGSIQGNRRSLAISATGDTGVYQVSVAPILALNVLGTNVLGPQTLLTGGTANTGLLCPGQYRVTMVGANCTSTKDVSIPFTCDGITTALTGISYDCFTNQLSFNIVPDSCSTSYTVQVLDSGLTVIAQSTYPNITNTSARILGLGVYPGDGNYTVKVTAGGCSVSYPLNLSCANPTACIISSDIEATSDGTFLDFAAVITLNEAGGTYSVTLRATTGAPASCSALGGTLATTNIVGVLGFNNVNFPNATVAPAVPTCYALQVQKLGAGNESCNDLIYYTFNPSLSSGTCSIDITNVSYNTTTGEVLVSWNGTNTSNDITVQIQVSADATCNGGDPLVINDVGRGEDGVNIPYSIPQISGQDQCITVNIFDTDDPTCAADTVEFTIVGCTCSVEVDADTVVVDANAETVEFDVITRCTSGTVDIAIGGDATGFATFNTASVNGTATTYSVPPVSLLGYPTSGGVIQIEPVDSADGGCIDTEEVILPANCVSCAQVADFVQPDSVVNIIKDIDNNNIVSGLYALLTPPNLVTLENDIRSGVVSVGGNFCAVGTTVDAAIASQHAGVTVNQDTEQLVDLNYVLLTNPAWVGTRQSYFGNCGCSGITRLCDYTAEVDLNAIAGGSGQGGLSLYFGKSSTPYGNSGFSDLGTIVDIDATKQEEVRQDIIAILNTATGCAPTYDDVTVDWDLGLLLLTITITGTNAPIGIIRAAEYDLVNSSYTEFTQSGCV